MFRPKALEQLKPLDVFKTGMGWFIGAGVTKIVYSVVEDHIDEDDYNFAQRGMIQGGKFGLALMIKAAVQDHIDARIDFIIKTWNEAMQEISEEMEKQERERQNQNGN